MSLQQILEIDEEQLENMSFRYSLPYQVDSKLYVKIKKTHYQQEGAGSIMLQIIDTSASILLNEEKANSHMLEMINACISHELRNPLNSIIAQSIENSDLYQEMKEIVTFAHPNALQ